MHGSDGVIAQGQDVRLRYSAVGAPLIGCQQYVVLCGVIRKTTYRVSAVLLGSLGWSAIKKGIGHAADGANCLSRFGDRFERSGRVLVRGNITRAY
jgi:hypothetical protein